MKSWRTIKVLCCCRQGLICNVSFGTRVNRTTASGKCLWPFLLPLLLPLLLFVLRFVLLRVLLLQRVLVVLLPPTAATYCQHCFALFFLLATDVSTACFQCVFSLRTWWHVFDLECWKELYFDRRVGRNASCMATLPERTRFVHQRRQRFCQVLQR
jgi:hypothetical protein